MGNESRLSKVIIRTLKGDTFAGFARKEKFKTNVKMIDQKGKENSFRIKDLKAVFFVQDFKGDPEYREITFLTKQRAGPHLWARLEMYDGEILEGRVGNNLELLRESGFYLSPSDEDTNNESAYIPKASLKSFTIISVG